MKTVQQLRDEIAAKRNKPGVKVNLQKDPNSLWAKFDNKMKTSKAFTLFYWFWSIPFEVIMIAILAQFSMGLITIIIGIWICLAIIFAWCYGCARMFDTWNW